VKAIKGYGGGGGQEAVNLGLKVIFSITNSQLNGFTGKYIYIYIET